MSDWTRYDVDGDGLNWADYFTVNDNGGNPVTPVSLISRSWQGSPKTPNNWIISPAISLASASGQVFLYWKVQCAAAEWDQEHYSVYVGTSSDMASLQASPVTFSETYNDPNNAGTQYSRTLDVSSFVGQTIYVAFRHHNVTDMDFISIDDVEVKAPPTTAPACVTQVSPANAATGINYKAPVALSWTAATTGPSASSYDVFFGNTPNPTTLLANVTGLTTNVPVTQLTSATTYYWRVVAKNEVGSATGCSEFSFTTANPPASAPNCATLNLPANGATEVSYDAAINLTWTAPTTGTVVDSYDLYLDTNPDPTTLLANKTTTSHSIPSMTLAGNTTYYWKVVPKNDTGAATGCTVFSFTTKPNPFAPYCGPLAITSTVEPITLVNFAGINNVTPAPTGSPSTVPSHENFTTIIGNVVKGETQTITLQGNTGGNWVNRFAVFIDWNQNGVLNDPGEVYEVTTTLSNSTGTDGKQVTHPIAVPATAMSGDTRMRVKKIFGTTNYLDPCAGASFGQVEDYTVNVATLAVADASKNQARVYPNPIVDIVNIDSNSKVSSVQVYDLSGKVVSTHTMNAVKNQINLGKLTPGVYMLKINTESGTQTVKVVKK
ncbi:GEVED domain-containing protein [Chryseobacterium suipulveris]|uniref:GEVED domain-containing protein n=1 Tax=Chryseobacterium suipulveris TaxID=2929800 RepID=A0ABY4BLK4_9FLAO|nr:GEVED domain-containing protein [Chryseobacterium suipulveris]UOE40068.1 GEVED domain-containing protein [Chryseobacterium suipulveris]